MNRILTLSSKVYASRHTLQAAISTADFLLQDLDIQYTVGVATDVPVIEYFVGPNTTDGVNGWLDVAVFLANLEDPPQVLTTSYAHQEMTWAFSITE